MLYMFTYLSVLHSFHLLHFYIWMYVSKFLIHCKWFPRKSIVVVFISVWLAGDSSLAILRAELKSQRKHVRTLKKKSLWSRILEDVSILN